MGFGTLYYSNMKMLKQRSLAEIHKARMSSEALNQDMIYAAEYILHIIDRWEKRGVKAEMALSFLDNRGFSEVKELEDMPLTALYEKIEESICFQVSKYIYSTTDVINKLIDECQESRFKKYGLSPYIEKVFKLLSDNKNLCSTGTVFYFSQDICKDISEYDWPIIYKEIEENIERLSCKENKFTFLTGAISNEKNIQSALKEKRFVKPKRRPRF